MCFDASVRKPFTIWAKRKNASLDLLRSDFLKKNLNASRPSANRAQNGVQKQTYFTTWCRMLIDSSVVNDPALSRKKYVERGIKRPKRIPCSHNSTVIQ